MKVINKRKLTPVFKRVIKGYMENVDESKWSVHDITLRFVNYSIATYLQTTDVKEITFDVIDLQELGHFITVAERMLFGRK